MEQRSDTLILWNHPNVNTVQLSKLHDDGKTTNTGAGGSFMKQQEVTDTHSTSDMISNVNTAEEATISSPPKVIVGKNPSMITNNMWADWFTKRW